MSEESEELWYPAFNLAENPFRWQDRATERAYDAPFELIPNEASELVISLLKSKTSAIIVGERGCGKSSALELAAENVGCVSVIGAPFLYDMVEELQFQAESSKELYQQIFFYRGSAIVEWIREFTIRVKGGVQTKTVCGFEKCPKKHRCDFGVEGMEGFPLIEKIVSSFPYKSFCPFKRWLVAREYEFSNEEWCKVFLLDVPDDVIELGSRYFRDFVRDLQFSTKGTVVLMATSEQYQRLARTEYFSRLPKLDFPELSREVLKQIYFGRLKGATSPLDDDALNYLVSRYRNPRTLIQNLGEILNLMRREGRKRPAGLKYVEKLTSSMKISMPEHEALERTLDDFREAYDNGGSMWVSNRDIQQRMKEKYLVEIDGKRLGILLKNKYKLTKKYAPDAQYRINEWGRLS